MDLMKLLELNPEAVTLLIRVGISSISLLVVYIIGHRRGTEKMKRTAANNGHAEYYLGPKYRRMWRWVTCKCEEKEEE